LCGHGASFWLVPSNSITTAEPPSRIVK
jgi:hypothetical protein